MRRNAAKCFFISHPQVTECRDWQKGHDAISQEIASEGKSLLTNVVQTDDTARLFRACGDLLDLAPIPASATRVSGGCSARSGPALVHGRDGGVPARLFRADISQRLARESCRCRCND